MNLRIIAAVITVPILAALFAWTMAWWVRSTTSEDSIVRWRARAVEILLALGVGVLSAATTASTKGREIALVVLAAIIAAWIFRGVRLLLANRRAYHSRMNT
jgi:hypothetical protein